MNLKLGQQARQDGSALTAEGISELKHAIKGKVVVRGEAEEEEYKDSITRWNKVYIQQSRLIAFPQNEDDVVQCVKYVGKHSLDVAVACGRHSYHGASSADGMIIDLREMRQVTIDKAVMTAMAEGGCLAADVEQAAEAEGLSVVFGAVNETGIGGLTLGGGIGALTGQHGLTLDNLLGARMVLASGEVVNVSAQENEDLFWAIRGGGPNFGICVEFKYRAHEQGPVWTNMMLFSPDKRDACISLIEEVRQKAVLPSNGKFQPMFMMITPPGAPCPLPVFWVFYDGSEEEGRKLAKPILDLGPDHEMGGVSGYAKTTEYPPALRYPGFERYAASSAILHYPLDTGLLTEFFDHFLATVKKFGDETKHSVCMLDLRDYRKMASVPADATAYSNRNDTALFLPEIWWSKPERDAEMRSEVSAVTAWVREKLAEAKVKSIVQDDAQRDVTAIYPNVSSGVEKSKSVFGSNLGRLQQIKKKYDPDLMWDKWYPIEPAA